MRRLHYTRRLSSLALRAISLAVLLVGIGLTVYACVQWLQTAHWQPLTVDGALTSWPQTREWVAHPRSWLGLHRVVVWVLRVPVFVVVTVLGLALSLVSAPPRLDSAESRATWSRR
jgi:hypothetical protein